MFKQEGKSIDARSSNQSAGSVNQRYQGSRQGDGSAQSGRQQLYYRGSPNQAITQGQLNQQQQSQQRRQYVPNTRSSFGGSPQNINPQGTIRQGGIPNSSNIRCYQGNGSRQGSWPGYPTLNPTAQRNFAPQSRGSFQGGATAEGVVL